MVFKRMPLSAPPLTRRRLLAGAAAGLASPAAAAGDTPTVVVDASAAPPLAGWAQMLGVHARRWWPLITAALASPGYTPPSPVRLVLSTTRPSAWAGPTEPGTVYVNAAASAAHPRHLLYIAHEMTHAAQGYSGPQRVWLVEGVADYVRYYVLFPQDPERFFPPAGADYRHGFNQAAALLDRLERLRGPGSVRALNATMRQGRDGSAALAEALGVGLDEAWRQVMTDLADGSPAPRA